MGASRRDHLKLVASGMKRKKINMDCLIEEESEVLISRLAAMTGKDTSFLMNEAIGELIRRYRPRTRYSSMTLKLIKC
jgi:hypothetical protein